MNFAFPNANESISNQGIIKELCCRTFTHLADAFLQSDLQSIQAIIYFYFLSYHGCSMRNHIMQRLRVLPSLVTSYDIAGDNRK